MAIITMIILCFIYIFTIVNAENKSLSIDLNPIRPAWLNMVLEQQYLQGSLNHTHFKSIERKLNQIEKTNGTVIPLFKLLDSEFTGNILIGHPSQSFSVIYGTAWPLSWITSKNCSNVDLVCRLKKKYDPKISSTSKITSGSINIEFESGNLTGNVWNDSVHIAQVNITGQLFAAVDKIPWELIYSKSDGVFGLGFEYNTNMSTIFHNLINQNIIKKSVMAIYINRDRTTPKGGSIVFGSVDNKRYKGNFTYLSVNATFGFWQFKMDRIFIKDKNPSFCINGCDAYIDSSNNQISGPEFEIEYINQLIKAKKFYFGRYSVTCSKIPTMPDITFVLNGRNFTLDSSYYVQTIDTGIFTLCLSAFVTNKYTPDSWSLGGAFLSKYYSVYYYNTKQIGFALGK